MEPQRSFGKLPFGAMGRRRIPMQTLVLKASPKRQGNTSSLADRVIAGLTDAGHPDITTFHLNELDIRPCQACDRCLKPPYAGCVLDDDFSTIYPILRDANLIVFATPVYWWHLCAQMKTFIDRMHTTLTFDRDHCLPVKDLVLVTAYLADDPYGIELVLRMFESITGWAGMGFHSVRFHSENGPVQDDEAKLAEAYALGHSFASWEKPELSVRCPVEGCGFLFRSLDHAAKHLVMAADAAHLCWKAEHLTAIHSIDNTERLIHETVALVKPDSPGDADVASSP
jgi:multimeric flavodoxin WrbA